MPKIISIDEVVGSKIPHETAGEIFDLVAKFASYGFNKSHAAAYAMIAYQTGYLKCHHPYEFYASSMNLDIDDTEKLAAFYEEVLREHLAVQPPSINASGPLFTVERDQCGRPTALRWALGAIRNVGVNAMMRLCALRAQTGPFRSLQDLVDRSVGIQGINSRALESLVKAGACDCVGLTRRAMLDKLDQCLKGAQNEARKRDGGQCSLFSIGLAVLDDQRLPNLPEMPMLDKLMAEHEVLGSYLSGHPLRIAAATLESCRTLTIANTREPDRQFRGIVRVGAMVSLLKTIVTKKGTRMAFLTLSDWTGAAEGVVFADDWSRMQGSLRIGAGYIFDVYVEDRGDERKLVIKDAEELPLSLSAAAA